MNLSELSDEDKIRLYEHVTKKFDWASKKNIKRLAQIEVDTGKFKI